MTDPTPGDRALGDLGRRLAGARDGLVELRPAVADGEPWPLAERFDTEPEASWGPREVLAHVAEMLPYWLGELERVVAVDGAAFGRAATDPLRLATIERDRTLPLPALDGRIDVGVETWLERLADLDEDTVARSGSHPRLGAMTVSAIMERFVVGHLEEHVAQLREIVGAR
ncbi:MAG: DinB family protein [Chloroflexota bacterium]